MSEWKLGPIFGWASFSKDKNDRLWGHTECNGKLRTRHVFSLHYVEATNGAGRYWNIYLGPLYICWSISKK